jgi:citrate synthase
MGGEETAETALSDVDGERGRLVVAGHDVEELAAGAGFEHVCGLLWHGELPGEPGRAALQRELGEARLRAHALLPELGSALAAPDAMDALRAATAHLQTADRAAVTGAVAVFAAAWARRRTGQPLLAPDPGLGHAADFLRMATGSAGHAKALDAYLVTVAEHGMNASTFAARVVTSTGSDLVSAVVAAIGALKGPLHGGAPGLVLEMLDAIGSAARAEPWLLEELAAGRRIMGMGHRIYRVRDPRAAVLEKALKALGASGPRLALARAVEQSAERLLAARHPGRALRAHVEL